VGGLLGAPELRPGGPARATVDVAAGVVAAGGRAVVVSAGGRLVADLLRCGATHITMPLPADNGLGRWATARRLVNLIREHRISIVHARVPGAAWLSKRAAEEAGVPYTLTCHGLYEDASSDTRRNGLLEQAAKLIAVSQTAADHIMNRHRIQDRPVVIAPGIDLARFDPTRVSAERMMHLAQTWRLPDGRPIVMLPGRIARSRGHGPLIEALGLIAARDFHCVFAAEDKASPGYVVELTHLAERHRLETRLVLGEDCRDMAAAYMLADVVIYARADAAGFARVVAEGQAMGRPIVAYDSPLLREHTGEARMTWLVPPGDRGALAQSIGEALDLSAAERQTLAPEASTIARRRYNHATAAAAMIEVFVDLLGRAKAA
jgi:glycosyltransferase involved in cell wall biosynthesis